MAQKEKYFEICTNYYIRTEDGEIIDLPRHVEKADKFLVCQKYFKYYYEGKWGLMDCAGRGVVPTEYQAIYELASDGRFLKLCLFDDFFRIWDVKENNFICGGETFFGINMTYMARSAILLKDKNRHWRVFSVKSNRLLTCAYENIFYNDSRYLVGWSEMSEDHKTKFLVCDMMHCKETIEINSVEATQYEIRGDFILTKGAEHPRSEEFSVYSLETGRKLLTLRGNFTEVSVSPIMKDGNYVQVFEAFFRNFARNQESVKEANWIFYDEAFIVNLDVVYKNGTVPSMTSALQTTDYYGERILAKWRTKASDICYDIRRDLDAVYTRTISAK